jgi:hypothetical protein
MSKAYKFTFVRRSIFEERFEVEADTLEEAEEMMQDGGYPDPVGATWIDWYEDEFSTDREFPPEPLCPLYKMVKDKECATS